MNGTFSLLSLIEDVIKVFMFIAAVNLTVSLPIVRLIDVIHSEK